MLKWSALLFILSVAFTVPLAGADSCPIPTSSIDPLVSTKVTFDRKSKTYTYNYTFANGATALLPIDEMSLSMSTAPRGVSSPANWDSDFVDYLSNFGWTTTALKPGTTSKVSGQLPTPSFAIKPGEKISGFSITSSQPPGAQQFFAAGVMQPPVVAPTNTEDEPLPNCPGIDVVNPRLQTLVTGLTIGPLPENAVSPKMRLREKSGEHKYGPIDPRQASGNVTLLILSSSTFDASQINLSSVKFGPAQIAPLRSKLVSAKENDDRHDEREEWERMIEPSGKDKRDSKLKNLLLTFDLKALDVQCVLDRALFFNASTNSGQKVIGGVSTRTIGCNLSHPGTHVHHLTKRPETPQRPFRKSTYKGEK